MWGSSKAACVVLAGLGLAEAARAEAPLSAIDWLSQSASLPVAMPVTPVPLPQPPSGTPGEPAVASSALPGSVTVQAIDGPSADAVGLLPHSVTGLPRDLWGQSATDRIIALLAQDSSSALPALRRLMLTLLLAEAAPPMDSDGRGRLFLARVDRLLALGALDQAQVLLDQADSATPEWFRRWFDVALLLGEEDRACARLKDLPQVAPSVPVQAYCLVRMGDWSAAALTAQTAYALGDLTAEDHALLQRFLDPELFEGEPDLPPPARATPLAWRMMEAIGSPLPTNGLPLAFAQGDLRASVGWKAQIEAAERLTRAGALPATRLFGLYTERKPAASGGVWDRATAVQALDRALSLADKQEVARTLPLAWKQMAEAELEVAFAEIYGAALGKLGLTGSAGALAFRIGLLSPDYEQVAQGHSPADSEEAFLLGLASGDVADAVPPDGMGAAIRLGLGGQPLSADLDAAIKAGNVGEAVLLSMAAISAGVTGDLGRVSDGLAALRRLGLESVVRRSALELMLLERRG